MFQNEDPLTFGEKISPVINVDDFSLGSYKKIYQAFLDYIAKHPKKFNLEAFTDELSSELQPVFDEIYLFASSELGLENEHIDKLTYEIKRFSLKRQIQTILSSEEKNNSITSNLRLKELTSELKEVEKKVLSL